MGLLYTYYFGSTSQGSYPYTARQGRCKKRGGSFRIRKIYMARASYSCRNIPYALKYGPLSVAVAVDSRAWRFVGGGIIRGCGHKLNHAVLLVGVNSSYWTFKNSWGKHWGQNGFGKLALNNPCGMCRYNAYLPY